MNYKELEDLHTTALALRNIADTVLAKTGQLLARRPVPKKSEKQIDRKASLTARLLSGQVKPNKKRA